MIPSFVQSEKQCIQAPHNPSRRLVRLQQSVGRQNGENWGKKSVYSSMWPVDAFLYGKRVLIILWCFPGGAAIGVDDVCARRQS